MFDVNSGFFHKKLQIPADVDVVFVSDVFVEDYVGGAELTTQALIDSSPYKIFKLHSKNVNLEVLEQGIEKFWIFGNFSSMDFNLIPSIVANLHYSLLEYDFKFCRYRSIEKHFSAENIPCNCHNQDYGKMVSAFFFGAKCLWWMSEKQLERYVTYFPFLLDKENTVLSSVFDDHFFATVKLLNSSSRKNNKYIVLGSNSWIKGFSDAENWCKQNNKEYEVVWNVPYHELLAKLAQAKGFVYLPKGGDTCPRMTIEAKLLGCELITNENVQHASEEWFNTDNLPEIEDYLYSARSRFWRGIKQHVEKKLSLSGYTTTYNCVSQKYPFEECIKSMLNFCNEVCVVDGGSNDGTLERLVHLAVKYQQDAEPANYDDVTIDRMVTFLRESGKEFRSVSGSIGPYTSRLRIKVVSRNWSAKRHAVFDGMQKAEARKMCTGDLCWQQDVDEVIHVDDVPKIRHLVDNFPPGALILSLPVIEFWSGEDKVRLDILPWKWRLSVNNPRITHGIPQQLRKIDEDGNVFACTGTDGCDMIDAVTGNPVPHVTFVTAEAEQCRQRATVGDPQARAEYENWFNQAILALPSVFHYSWFNLERKIKLYQQYWVSHWKSLYDVDIIDSPENNPMFDKRCADVTDDDIKDLAQRLTSTGGHVWHSKWKGTKTPWMSCHRPMPETPSCLKD